MKKTEKIVTALVTIAVGMLLIFLRGDLIKIVMTVLGLGLIALGVIHLFEKQIPLAVIKLAGGVLIIVCGLTVVGIVLYILAVALVVCGILLLYEKIKSRSCQKNTFSHLSQYVTAIFFIVVGLLLFFNQSNTVEWIFIVSGVLTIGEGGVLLFSALIDD